MNIDENFLLNALANEPRIFAGSPDKLDVGYMDFYEFLSPIVLNPRHASAYMYTIVRVMSIRLAFTLRGLGS